MVLPNLENVKNMWVYYRYGLYFFEPFSPTSNNACQKVPEQKSLKQKSTIRMCLHAVFEYGECSHDFFARWLFHNLFEVLSYDLINCCDHKHLFNFHVENVIFCFQIRSSWDDFCQHKMSCIDRDRKKYLCSSKTASVLTHFQGFIVNQNIFRIPGELLLIL
jgi:hypothetical protein